MKRLFLAAIFLLGLGAWVSAASNTSGRGFTIVSNIGPATSQSAAVVLGDPGSDKYNCITHVTVISTNTYTFRILDNSTTIYSLIMPTGSGFVEDWPIDDAVCNTLVGSTITLSVTSTAIPYDINYKGFIRQ